VNRSEFFAKAFTLAVGKAAEAVSAHPLGEMLERLGAEAPAARSDGAHRPPGAEADPKRFLELCTGCDRCMSACPHHLVLIEDLERRDPLILPEQSPCLRCDGYPCIASCPTGALSLEKAHEDFVLLPH
jgi:ferredoxin-type protein NapG